MNTLEARRRLLGRNVYKRTTEGNPAIAQGSLARRYPGITMQGWTEQAQYEGSQLFDYTKSEEGMLNAEGNIETGESYRTSDFIPLDSEKKYIISATGSKRGKYYNSEKKPIRTGEFSDFDPEKGTQIIPNETIAYCRFTYMKESESTIMLNEGSTLKPYEPYTGEQPSPSPDYPQEIVSAGNWNEENQKWEYEVKLTGANLWDKEKASITDNWIESTSQLGYSDFAVDVLAGQKITVSFPETLSTGLGYYVGIVLKENGPIISWMYHTTTESLIAQKKTVISTENKIWIRCNLNGIEDFVSGNPQFQIEYGDKRTKFMSYLKRSVTLTSDRPLTKWDRLEKRGGQWGWVYKSGTISGNDINIIQKYNDEIIEGMLRHSFGTSFIPGYEHRDNIFCNKLVDSRHYDNFDFAYSVLGTGILRIISNDNTGIDTLEEMQTYWASLPDVVFYYETAEETFVPLSTSDQEQMNELHTFHPTTVLSNDAGCEMSLTYKTKKSLEVTT